MKLWLVFYSLHTFFVYVLPLVLMDTAHTAISRPLKAQHSTVDSSNISKENLTEIPTETQIDPDPTIYYTSERQMLEKIKAMEVYIRNRRVVRILIVIVIVFFMLWCPFIVIRLLKHAGMHVNELVYKVSQMIILTTTAVNFLFMRLSVGDCVACFVRYCAVRISQSISELHVSVSLIERRVWQRWWIPCWSKLTNRVLFSYCLGEISLSCGRV